jgi:hypothetical protein
MRKMLDDNCLEANKDLLVLSEYTDHYSGHDWA